MTKHNAAFSLIELLVAVAVLFLVVFLLSHIFSITSSAIRVGNERSDAFSISRQALDRMRLDWRQAVPLEAHDVKWEKQPGNDAISLTASVPSSSGTRLQLSQIQHRFTPDQKGLLRASVGLNYAPGDPAPDSNPHLLGAVRYPDPPAAALEEFAQSIIRLEVSFLVTDELGALSWRADEPADPKEEVRAISLAMVALDRQTGESLEQNDAESLAAIFPDARDGEDLVNVWTSLAKQSDAIAAASPGVPPPIGSKLRVFHRLYVVPPYAP